MKKQLATLTTTIAAALGLLLLAACANPFINPRERENPADEGKGLVRIETGAGPARTALPNAVFDHYEYSFSHEGGPAQTIAPVKVGGDEFELETGNWEVTVEAYAGSGDDTLAAQGSGSFSVNLGVQTEVTVKLSPVVSGGTGTLNYALAYPDGTVVSSFTLTLLAEEIGIDLLENAVSGSRSLTGTVTVGAGYYLARAFAQKDGVAAGKNEVVHIYNNLTTDLELQFVEDNFKGIVVVSSADGGPGTLREALTNVMAADVDGATIRIDLPEGDRVITLRSVLPTITKSLVIEGNGATLTQRGFTAAAASQLLYINSAAAEVHISRLHFTGGRATSNGGAIRNTGRLILESCVFSDNMTSATAGNGGAVYTTGGSSSLTISGCTFYGNTAGTTGGSGGAVYVASGAAATLTGNAFWGNTANQRSVVYGAVTSGGFNVFDKTKGTDDADSGLVEDTDTQTSSRPLSYISFRPLGSSDILNRITTKPEGYPAADFYGVAIPETDAAAGAAQTAATGTGFYLDYAPQGGAGRVSADGTVDFDGFADATVTLTASDGVFRHWIVDGTKHGEPSNVLTLTVDKDTTVRAVFSIVVTSVRDSGSGTLREALTGIGDEEVILLPAGRTITLNTPLPQITKSLVIEGNGATVIQRGFTMSDTSQLLYINSATAVVRISRLHFNGGRTTTYGGAIRNTGKLTLESCVFSGNQANSNGGAIYITGTAASATVSGCTFYGNSAGNSGGAIYRAGGTVTLTGNVFWGNTAAQHSVVYGTASITSGGFNVSDKADGSDADLGSGWSFEPTDIPAMSLPISPLSFKPIAGGEALSVISGKPVGYPDVDFYGVTIPGNAAAGAIQTATGGTGYYLDYVAAGPGTVSVAGSMDEDGLINSGSVVTLTAQAGANGQFMRWILDGLEVEEQSPPNQLAVTMDDHKTVRAVFYFMVTNTGNNGPGSLREVLAAAGNGDGIILPAGETITLTSPLDPITKSFIIEGKGATLTQSGFTPSDTSQLLYINSTGAEVHISRLHFKGGRARTNGAAINNTGKLTLESCIFSDNRTRAETSTPLGGAIYTSGNINTSYLTVSGCTFYGNTTMGRLTGISRGGAIYRQNGVVTLTGNVFWGNTAIESSVVYFSSSAGATTNGYNISDKASGRDSTLGSGWTFDLLTDIQAASLPISPISFKPINGGEALTHISIRPADYPTTDFYGTPIPSENAAAGAIQMATAEADYFLDYAPTGPGTVTAAGLIMDNDGLISNDKVVTLTAQANTNGTFRHWTVNGVEAEEQSLPNKLAVTMDGHKVVRAVFYIVVTDTGNSGPGTLRDALESVDGGSGIVLPANETITLTSSLDPITKSLVIEGNGATLTQNSLSRLLSIDNNYAEVRISRLHFRGGRATSSGAAINNTGGELTLESCIFSDNRTTSATATGGAIYSIIGINTNSASLAVSGCTFYENTAGTTGGRGGAIYVGNGTATLTGNIFWGNSAAQRSVVYGSPASGGYNVSDKADGPDNTTGSGWDFVTGDTPLSEVNFDADFRPSHTDLPAIPSPPVGNPNLFPLRYFDGTIREAGSAPGAMPAQ
jgi:predicted outer membrane repeat protein